MIEKGRTWIFIATCVFVIIFAVVSIWIFFLYTPITHNPKGIQYTVKEGATFRSVIEDLKRKNIIEHPFFFSLLIHLRHDTHHLKAGEYQFAKGTTLPKILNQMLTGTGLVQYPFTIIAGWNFKQVRAALEKEEALYHTIQNMSDHDIMIAMGSKELNPEGKFFPDTYFYIRGYSDIRLLKRAYKTMASRLQMEWQQRAGSLPYTIPYQALIAASLIEKEAHYDIERPLVSSVLVNRLRKNMLLQIDPTVIYGIGDRYDGKLYKSDLSKPTPYNTYINKGLPPTPIAMPGLESLRAAMHPDHDDYLYFVARGDGYHQFSKSLVEHNKAVQVIKKNRESFFNVSPWFFIFSSPRVLYA